ncbi:MAG: alpha/beta fold hydrolase [Planctomycetota bacterium]
MTAADEPPTRTAAPRTPRVLFLHGLEGRPDGAKGRALAAHFEVHAPTLDTSAARELARRHGLDSLSAVRERVPDSEAALELALRTPLDQARAALAAAGPVDVAVGSSFGGALLLELVHRGHWNGPSLSLVQSGRALLPDDRWWPPHLRALLVHGTADEVVPIAGSHELFSRAGDHCQLWEVHDGHPLAAFTASGGLERAVRALHVPNSGETHDVC